MKIIDKINQFFSSGSAADVYTLEVADRIYKISKINKNFIVSDKDSSLEVAPDEMSDFISSYIKAQPNEEEIKYNKNKLEEIKETIEVKKREGSLVETSPNVYQTTSGVEFEIKEAFGTLWIIKRSAGMGTWINQEDPEFDNLLRELLSSGFLSDSKLPLHYKHISDQANKAKNFPCTLSQTLVLDLIRDNVVLKGLAGNWFTWGIEGSPLVPDSGEPTLFLLLNGKKVAKPYISENRLKWDILDSKEILDQVLPEFETDGFKPTKMKVSDVLKVADSIQSKTMRLLSPPYVLDVFLVNGKKSVLFNGYRSAVADSAIATSQDVLNIVEVPLISERLNLEELLNLIYKQIIFYHQASVFYLANSDNVYGKESYVLTGLYSEALWSCYDNIKALHRRAVLLGGNSAIYANPATWSTVTGVAQIVTEVPFTTESSSSNALSLEMTLISNLQQIVDFTKDSDQVTCMLATEQLGRHQRLVKDLQNVLQNISLT